MSEQHRDRADRLADRLAIPVLVAALASVPAVFLTLMDDPWETFGSGLNLVSGAVLVAETVVLFAVAEDRRGWLRRNRFLVGLTVVIVPAVIFAVGPVQLLRLVRAAGALRIIRVGRILRAGKVLQEKTGMTRTWQRGIWVGVSLLGAAFVAVVLADPTSDSRRFLDDAVDRVGTTGVILAGLLLAGATYVVVTNRGDEGDEDDAGGDQDAGDDQEEPQDGGSPRRGVGGSEVDPGQGSR